MYFFYFYKVVAAFGPWAVSWVAKHFTHGVFDCMFSIFNKMIIITFTSQFSTFCLSDGFPNLQIKAYNIAKTNTFSRSLYYYIKFY